MHGFSHVQKDARNRMDYTYVFYISESAVTDKILKFDWFNTHCSREKLVHSKLLLLDISLMHENAIVFGKYFPACVILIADSVAHV